MMTFFWADMRVSFAGWSDRIPGEHVTRAVEWEKVGPQHRQRGVEHALGRPAFAAVGAADRPWLAEEIDLVVAHAEDLAGDVARRIGAQADDERRDTLGHELLQALHTLLLLGCLAR